MMKRKGEDKPIYAKALEIWDITHALTQSIDSTKDELEMGPAMLSNAGIIRVKLASAEGCEIYSLKMENAMLIKLAARELQALATFCHSNRICKEDYAQLLRVEIENFRQLYKEWILGFDKSDDIDDGWGWDEVW